jgi:hypothetical protein
MQCPLDLSGFHQYRSRVAKIQTISLEDALRQLEQSLNLVVTLTACEIDSRLARRLGQTRKTNFTRNDHGAVGGARASGP